MRRDVDEAVALDTALAGLHVRGIPVDWAAVIPSGRADLPTYAFQRQRFWPDVDQTMAPLPDPLPVTDMSILDTVRTEVAQVLGLPHPVGPDERFAGLGLDSLTMIDLRAALKARTGKTIVASAMVDHPTAAALAAHIEELTDRDTTPSDIITVLHRQAIGESALARADALLSQVAGMRVTSLSPAPPPLVRLTPGEAGRHLVCVAPIVPTTGTHVYRGLSTEMPEWGVSVLTPSGFADGEELPSTWSALITQLGTAVLTETDDGPLVLLGTSTGGLLAHEVARWLAERGRTVNAAVLWDTYLPGSTGLATLRPALWQEMYAREVIVDGLDWVRLSATAHYERMLAGWRPHQDTTFPALLLSASVPLPGVAEDRWQRADLPGLTEIIDAPGDHMSMLHEHVAAAAALTTDWLACQEELAGFFPGLPGPLLHKVGR
jgi:thioesterase domain-containing protein/acyl carrier protein